VENYLFVLLAIWEHASPLVESYILFLEDPYHLVHFVSIFEVQEKAPLGVYEVSRILFRDVCQWQSVLHCNTVL
jgi:hypothetical protein